MSSSPPSPGQVPGVPAHVPPELVRLIDLGTGFNGRPHDFAAELHSGPPIVFTPTHHSPLGKGGTWLPIKARDMRTILGDPETFSNEKTVEFGKSIGESWSLVPIEFDPPVHRKYRTIMNPLFSLGRMNALEEKVRRRAASLTDACFRQGRCEFVEDFARVFPSGIFLDLMGLPEENLGQFLEWEHIIFTARDPVSRVQALRDVTQYLKDEIAERRRRPADDLITFAVTSKIDDRLLTDDEVIGLCVMLYTAGLDTVASSLGFHFRHLAEHPADQQALRDDPGLIPSAVEEFFRAYSIVNATRFATKDAEIAGVTIKRGDRVVCSTVIASRDPDEYERPNEIIFSRKPNRHLAFSFGPHICIGAHLARREITIAFQEWLGKIPTFRITPGIEITAHGGGSMGVDLLPLEW